MAQRLSKFACAVAALIGPMVAQAQALASELEWQIGFGAATLSFPAYRGSSVRENLALPVPTFTIRAPRFELGRDGARIDLFESAWLHFRLSAGGSLPVDSDNVPLRAGMDDLNPSFELGPAAVIEFPCPAPWRCRQETLLRSVVATDFHRFDSIGWTLQPRLNLKYVHGDRQNGQLQWRVTLGPLWASRKYHDYFYSVNPAQATANRPAYTAAGGFSGWRSSFSMTWRKRLWGISFYTSYDQLDRAQFRDSPLFERKQYLVAGTFIRRYFWSSANLKPTT